MIGFNFILGSDKDGWSVQDFRGTWARKPSDGAKWSEDSRALQLGGIVMKISALLKDAKVMKLGGLIGKPVEVIFEDNSLKSWRILTEVI